MALNFVCHSQGTSAQQAGIRLDSRRLQAFWGQCETLLEWAPEELEEDEDEEAAAEKPPTAAVQRQLAALNGFGRIALQQVSPQLHTFASASTRIRVLSSSTAAVPQASLDDM